MTILRNDADPCMPDFDMPEALACDDRGQHGDDGPSASWQPSGRPAAAG